MFAAIILARGGSKRLPGKNLKKWNGKPLVAWTIRAAIDSSCFDTVIVNTDSPEIKEISEAFGAKVPSLRPAHLAGDSVSSEEVIGQTLDDNPQITSFALLQPTSPLRTARHIREATVMFTANNRKSLVSAEEVGALGDDYFISNTRSLSRLLWGYFSPVPLVKLNGAIYMSEVSRFRRHNSLVPRGTQFYIMPTQASIDIDHESDFYKSERLFEQDEKSQR